MSITLQWLLPFLYVFITSIHPVSDPDLGWHLKYGEFIFENGFVLKENTFSSQMTDFSWTNISWGIDALTFLIFHNFGFVGLSIVGAIVVAFTFHFFSVAFKLDFWEKAIIFPCIYIWAQPVLATSFRGQNLSLLFLSILYQILSKYDENKKLIYFVPVLFLFWSNLHGLFILGLVVFALWMFFYIFSKYWETAKLPLLDIRNFCITTMTLVLLTLIHPYGIFIYKDSLTYIGNPLLKNIAEYVPFESMSLSWYAHFFATILALCGVIIFIYSKKIIANISNIGIFLVLYLLSLSIKRYVWAAYFLMIPILKPIAAFLKPDKKRQAQTGATFLFLAYIFVVIYLKYPLSKYLNTSWHEYCLEFNNCSQLGAEHLKNYYVFGKTMTYYGWGGWLIWNYPDLKPSIDGRMHLWKDNGFSAFEHDFLLEQGVNDIQTAKYDVVFMYKDKPLYNSLDKLVEEGLWEKKFEDDTSGIFTRI